MVNVELKKEIPQMTQEKLLSNKKLIAVYAVLILAIAVVAFLFLFKEKITFSGDYGLTLPNSLIEKIEKAAPGINKKDIQLIFVFNNYPTQSEMSLIEKLHLKTKENIGVFAFFNKPFRFDNPILFPHRISRNLVIENVKFNARQNEKYYMIISGGKIDMISNYFDLSQLGFTLQKRLNPGKDYQDYTLSIDALKSRIIDKIRKGNFDVYSVESGKYESIETVKKYSRIYFFHAPCSICRLKSYLSEVNIKGILDQKASVLIMPIMSDSFQLEEYLRESGLTIPVYLDNNDEFSLFSVITDEKKNPIIIEKSEFF